MLWDHYFHGIIRNLNYLIKIFVGYNIKLFIVVIALSWSQGLNVLCKVMEAGNTKDCLGISGWNWWILYIQSSLSIIYCPSRHCNCICMQDTFENNLQYMCTVSEWHNYLLQYCMMCCYSRSQGKSSRFFFSRHLIL